MYCNFLSNYDLNSLIYKCIYVINITLDNYYFDYIHMMYLLPSFNKNFSTLNISINIVGFEYIHRC